jgi:hypothetical protein
MFKCLVFTLAVPALLGAPYAANAAMLSQDQCQAVWNKADSAKTGLLTQIAASPYITDFKSANTSGSGKLTQDEFMAACDMGLVTDSASSGASTGSSGSSLTQQSETS